MSTLHSSRLKYTDWAPGDAASGSADMRVVAKAPAAVESVCHALSLAIYKAIFERAKGHMPVSAKR